VYVVLMAHEEKFVEAHTSQVTTWENVPVEKVTLAPPKTMLYVSDPTALAMVRVSVARTLRGL